MKLSNLLFVPFQGKCILFYLYRILCLLFWWIFWEINCDWKYIWELYFILPQDPFPKYIISEGKRFDKRNIKSYIWVLFSKVVEVISIFIDIRDSVIRNSPLRLKKMEVKMHSVLLGIIYKIYLIFPKDSFREFFFCFILLHKAYLQI